MAAFQRSSDEKLGNILHLKLGVFDVPELIANIYFAPKPFISVKITVEKKPRPLLYTLCKFDRAGKLEYRFEANEVKLVASRACGHSSMSKTLDHNM